MRFRNFVSFLSIVVASLGLVCCSAKVVADPHSQAQQVTETKTKQSSSRRTHHNRENALHAEGETWALDVKYGWNSAKLDQQDENDPMKIEFFMESDKLSDGNSALASVITMDWDRPESEFAPVAARAFSMVEGVKIVKMLVGQLGDSDAALVFALTTNDTVVVMQMSVASGNTGHIVRCAGSVSNVSEVLNACEEVFSGFSLKTQSTTEEKLSRPIGTMI